MFEISKELRKIAAEISDDSLDERAKLVLKSLKTGKRLDGIEWKSASSFSGPYQVQGVFDDGTEVRVTLYSDVFYNYGNTRDPKKTKYEASVGFFIENGEGEIQAKVGKVSGKGEPVGEEKVVDWKEKMASMISRATGLNVTKYTFSKNGIWMK
jgi:DNA helicase IV